MAEEQTNRRTREITLKDLSARDLAEDIQNGKRDFSARNIIYAASIREYVREINNYVKANLSSLMQNPFNFNYSIFRDDTNNPHFTAKGIKLPLADFSYADLEGVDFEGSNLLNAKFNGAKLKDVVFTETFLGIADFRGAMGLDEAVGLKEIYRGSKLIVTIQQADILEKKKLLEKEYLLVTSE